MNAQRMCALVEFNPFKSDWCAVEPGFAGENANPLLVLKPGETVVTSDEEGEDLGKVVAFDTSGSRPTEGTVLRRATPEDLRVRAELDAQNPGTLELFRRLRDEFQLEMQVVGVHWRLDRKKVCFYFVSDKKLNFRMFHKALASALGVRVAIKQIGVRDHARLLGGIGPCGRVLCCQQFLKELKPITLRMARQQNLFVEPTKISGICGKLLCCLAYEEETYRWLIACPHVGDRLTTNSGIATVLEVNPLSRRLRVRYENGVEDNISLEEVNLNE